MKKRYANFFLRVGVGGYIAWETEQVNILCQLGVMLGKRNSHFETSLGACKMWWSHSSDPYPVSPSLSLGYRWQKPSGKFVFRTGAGSPELIYVGCGFTF